MKSINDVLWDAYVTFKADRIHTVPPATYYSPDDIVEYDNGTKNIQVSLYEYLKKFYSTAPHPAAEPMLVFNRINGEKTVYEISLVRYHRNTDRLGLIIATVSDRDTVTFYNKKKAIWCHFMKLMSSLPRIKERGLARMPDAYLVKKEVNNV